MSASTPSRPEFAVAEDLKVGVIGLGMGERHSAAYQEIAGARLVAICDVDAERAERVAAELGAETSTTDWQELCDLGLDLVSVCSPDHLHHRMAKAAMEGGAHVLCEKPMTTTREDAEDLVRTAERTGRKLAVGNVNRFVPQIRAVHDLVAKGRLGELFMVEANYIHDMRNVYVRTPWRIDPDIPQNPWIAGASHAMDLVRWLAGDIDEIMLYDNHVAGTKAELPDHAISMLRFASGCLGRVWLNKGLRRWPEHIVQLGAYGSEGTALTDTESMQVTAWLDPEIGGQMGPTVIPFQPTIGHPVVAELTAFVRNILDDTEPLVDGRAGAATIATLCAGLDSAASGRPQKVRPIE
jgi:UDP-N-acetylglucosamine 3-dehydrogenase